MMLAQTFMADSPEQGEQFLTYMAVQDKIKERDKGHKLHLVNQWFNLKTLKYQAIVGSHSITSPPIKTRWLMAKYAYAIGGTYVTPGTLARTYLDIHFAGKKRRVTTNQYHEVIAKHRRPPLFVRPAMHTHGVYVDLKSAYWNILRVIGWDVDYMPGKWLAVKSDVEDFPFPENKIARNALVSVGLSGNMKIWDGSQLHFVKKPNGLYNMMLWTCVQDVLNGIASDVINAGADYVFTDGYICSYDKLPGVLDAIAQWGLPVSFKGEGETHVKRAGAYRVGKVKSKPYSNDREHGIDRVYPIQKQWLKERFRFFADRRGVLS